MNRRDMLVGSATFVVLPIQQPSQDWINDCLRWRGKVLVGGHAHWCADWDYLPIDETTPEWGACSCYDTEAHVR